MRKAFFAVGFIYMAVVALACQQEPGITSNIEATVEARVQRTVEAQSTQQPTMITTTTAPTKVPLSSPVKTSIAPTAILRSTPTPRPTMTPTSIPSTATLVPSVRLAQQLPRTVFEEFKSNFYGGCNEPPFDELRVTDTWSGNADAQIEFIPSENTYFLVVTGNPVDSGWQFDSIFESASGRRFQSLKIDNSVPDDTIDAQKWCSQGFGIASSNVLYINSSNVDWTVYLVSESNGDQLSRMVATALTGYYGACPPMPPIETLQATILGSSSATVSQESLSFTGAAPHYFLGVHFNPIDTDWLFESTNVSGDWKTAGPTVNNVNRQTIDFTATCPSSSRPHHLEVIARGGEWVVYLITMSDQ